MVCACRGSARSRARRRFAAGLVLVVLTAAASGPASAQKTIGTYFGYVKDACTGEGIGGATITACCATGIYPRDRSYPDGAYLLDVPYFTSEDKWRIRAAAKGYHPEDAGYVPVSASNSYQEVNFDLRPSSTEVEVLRVFNLNRLRLRPGERGRPDVRGTNLNLVRSVVVRPLPRAVNARAARGRTGVRAGAARQAPRRTPRRQPTASDRLRAVTARVVRAERFQPRACMKGRLVVEIQVGPAAPSGPYGLDLVTVTGVPISVGRFEVEPSN